MVLKYIRLKRFSNQYAKIVREMIFLDDNTRHNLIKYMMNNADADKQTLLAVLIDALPEDQEVIMTVGEQLRQERKHEYMQQGMQQVRKQGKYEVAQNMLAKGLGRDLIAEVTGLSVDVLNDLDK